jgi:hypothetical protein
LARAREDQLERAIEVLHRDALGSIRTAHASRYESVADAYEGMLLAFPRAWAEYGQEFEEGIATGFDLFSGPFDQVIQNLFEEMVVALEVGNREIALTAATLPVRVAIGAVDLGASALIRRLLNLQVSGYRYCSELDTTSPLLQLVKERFSRHLIEFGWLHVGSRLEDRTLSVESHKRIADALRIMFDITRDLLKTMIDHSDLAGAKSLDEGWSEVIQHWDPEYFHPQPHDLEFLGQELSDEERSRLERQADQNAELASLKGSLVDRRARHRFALAIWSLRAYRAGEDSKSLEFFRTFAGHFPRLEDVVGVTDLVMSSDIHETSDWDRWILEERGGRVGVLDTQGPILDGFLTLAALTVSPGGQAAIDPLPWLRDQRERIEERLRALESDERMNEVTPDWNERLESVKSAVLEAAQRREEQSRAELAEASIDSEKVDRFVASVKEGWSQHRLGWALHDHWRRSVVNEGEGPSLVWRQGAWVPKTFFLPTYPAELRFGSDIGRGVADAEMEQLITALSGAPASEHQGSLEDRVAFASGQIRDAGFVPSIALAPVSWRLREYVFGLRRRNLEEAPQWVPEGSRHWYVGGAFDLLFFDWPRIPTDRLYVLDPSQFSVFKSWTFPDGELLQVRVMTFDQDEAHRLATEQPNLMADKGVSVEERAFEARLHVYVHGQEKFQIERVAAEAARAVQLPKELVEED